MSDVARLLPRHYTVRTRAFSLALAAAMSDDLPVPIRAALDPAATPVDFLPFLAAHDGVRLWFSDWTEARRRQVVAEAPQLAGRIGTRPALVTLLGYVDATLVDTVSYPERFVLGRAVIGRTPIGHGPWLARYLVKVVTHKPPRAFAMSRAVIGRSRLKTPSREPFRRALMATRAAKGPETEYRIDFAHKRPLTVEDAPVLDGSFLLGAHVDRHQL